MQGACMSMKFARVNDNNIERAFASIVAVSLKLEEAQF